MIVYNIHGTALAVKTVQETICTAFTIFYVQQSLMSRVYAPKKQWEWQN